MERVRRGKWNGWWELPNHVQVQYSTVYTCSMVDNIGVACLRFSEGRAPNEELVFCPGGEHLIACRIKMSPVVSHGFGGCALAHTHPVW